MKRLIVLSLLLCLGLSALAGTISPKGQLRSDMYMFLNNARKGLMDVTLGNPNVATADGLGTTVNVQSTVDYTIGGLYYSLSSGLYDLGTPDITVPTQSASTTKYYLLSVDSSGTVTVDAGQSSFYPILPDDHAPIAGIKVTTLAGGSFRFGQTNFGATSVNTAIEDIRRVPTGYSKVSLQRLWNP